jgi:nucleoside-diphosphate-sugar epimerase
LPISPYATAKLAGENYARSFHNVYGLETVTLRYFNVFGPRQDPMSQYAAVVPRFIATLLTGGQPVIFGDGEQSRDFTPVANVVQANVLAMDAPAAAGRVYNIACGEQVSVNSLASEIGALLDVAVAPEYIAPRPGEVAHSLADLSQARADLGYEPRVRLREGLEQTIAYVRDHEPATGPDLSRVGGGR